jgi:hypothetical protein
MGGRLYFLHFVPVGVSQNDEHARKPSLMARNVRVFPRLFPIPGGIDQSWERIRQAYGPIPIFPWNGMLSHPPWWATVSYPGWSPNKGL